jgi:hypothetical protein
MLMRVSMSLQVLGALALVLALTGATRADDPPTTKQLQETVAKLEKKIADLEAKVAALEKLAKAEPATKPDKDEEEYAKAAAGAMLDSLLLGDNMGLRNKMTQAMEFGIDPSWNGNFSEAHQGAVGTWVRQWNAKEYKSHTIEKVVFSPNKEEIVVTGTLSDKEGIKATYTMTLVKKDKKLLLDAVLAKPK